MTIRGAAGRGSLAFITMAALAIVFLSGSGEPTRDVGEDAVVFVQVPVGTLPSPTSAGTLDNPYPPGSRVCVWSAADPDGDPQVLSVGLSAAGAPSISADGTTVLFSGRRSENDPWSVYEVDLKRGTPRRVTPPELNAQHPDYLAGERIVFSAPVEAESSFSLYTCNLDGSGIDRITFNPGSDVHPTVLRDGRVLHAAWQPGGADHPAGGWGLFTVRSDGTGILPFHGSHDELAWKGAPRELGDGRVGFLAATRPGAPVSFQTVALARPLVTLDVPSDRTTREWLSASAWSDDSLLVSLAADRGSGGSAGLYVMLPNVEAPSPLFDDPVTDDVDAIPVQSRSRPRGLVSDTRPGSETGTLLCLDARRTDRFGLPEVRVDAVSVRIYRRNPSDPRAAQETVAEVPLAADGSFLVDVPADTPLRFETVDASGDVILDSKGWIWVRPGEQRGCIGCHEDRETAPPNRLPLAVLPETDPTEPARIAMGGSK